MSSEWPEVMKAISAELATILAADKLARELAERGVPEPDSYYEADTDGAPQLVWRGRLGSGKCTWVHVFCDHDGEIVLWWSDVEKIPFRSESFHTSNYDEVANRIKEVLKVIGWKEPV